MKFIKTYANLDAYNNDNKKPYPNTLHYIEENNQIVYEEVVINISDPEVRRILTTDFGLPIQGEGFHMKDIQSITDLGESFANNELIETFEEFKYFTGIPEIKSSTFFNCISLTSITLPESVTSLGEGCFSNCSSLTSIDIPESVTSLEGYCFVGCTSLTSITLPESVTSLGGGCFQVCSSLTSINIPEGVTVLGEYCFMGCSSLTSIDIPEGVTSLGWNCFDGCESLTSITLPKSLTILGERCFMNCNALTSIDIPEGVTSLGEYCFYDCSSLILATVLPTTPPSLGASAFNYPHASFNIKVHPPYVDDYKTATNWAAYADKISAIEE